MTETRTCEYNVQPMPENEPRTCGAKGVKRATGQGFEMTYCKKHWDIAEERVTFMKYKVVDLG